MRSRLLLVIVLMMLVVGVSAQTDSATINKEAADSDFITASLLVIEPGKQPYSAYGHAAIRMQCPSKGLDYCFTFEMPLTTGSELAFVFGRGKGGFEAVETSAFVDEYRQHRRGIKAYTINLTPKEKQRLWKVLDDEVREGFHWDYDAPKVNCANMCQYAVEKSLEGERIVYGKLNPLLTSAKYSEMVEAVSANRPWTRIALYLIIIGHWSDTGQPEDKLTPTLLAETWQSSTFQGNGTERPMIVGKAVQLVPPMYKVPEPMLFTPTVVLVIIVLVVLIVTIVIIERKRKKHKTEHSK